MLERFFFFFFAANALIAKRRAQNCSAATKVRGKSWRHCALTIQKALSCDVIRKRVAYIINYIIKM